MFQREEPRKGYNQIKAKPKFKSIKNNGTWCLGSTSNLLGSEGLYLYSSIIYSTDIFISMDQAVSTPHKFLSLVHIPW